MSITKILKIVEWLIEVPDGLKDFANEEFDSSIFPITFDNVTTYWRLAYNLNCDNNGGNFYVYLERCSEATEIGFDCNFSASIPNSAYSFKTDFLKSKWAEIDSFGCGSSLMSSKDLKEKRNELCPHGKLHLKIRIQATKLTAESDSSLKEVYEEPNHKINFINLIEKSEKVFNLISTSESDILIKTDDGMVLKAHKSVLSEKSTVFQSMFTLDMEEAASQSVDIIEFKGPVMQELLRFIYFGQVKSIEQVDVELFKAATVYNVEELLEICLKSITAGVDHKNVFEIVQFTELYGLGDLFQHCCDKIQNLRHHQEIQKQLDDIDMKLQIKIMKEIIARVTRTEVPISIETCSLPNPLSTTESKDE